MIQISLSTCLTSQTGQIAMKLFILKTKITIQLHLFATYRVSCLYCTQYHTTCFGYTAIIRCITYIKMLKLLLKLNGSVNLVSK
jgi:hypothetical protein